MKEKENNKRSHSVFSRFLNTYTIAILLFGIWLIFFDDNSLIKRMQLRSKIETLKKERNYYQKKIEEDYRKTQELVSNKKNLEKFAREQYLMKRANEDIFIIVNE